MEKPICRILIGHRGVGKTQLLGRISKYFPDSKNKDLDEEIIFQHGPIEDIFKNKGELEFRKLEHIVFRKILKEVHSEEHLCNLNISLGAGFNLKDFKINFAELFRLFVFEIIYVSRSTDKDGRIFLNRPRLDLSIAPLEEFQERYEIRNKKFLEIADWVYHLPEGVGKNDDVLKIEKSIFGNNFSISGMITIQSHDLQNISRLRFLEKKYSSSHILFELRDDLLNPLEIKKIIDEFSNLKFIYSVRSSASDYNIEFIQKTELWDWPLELGNPPEELQIQFGNKLILSNHESDLTGFALIKNCLFYKWAPKCGNLKEIEKGLDWFKVNPQKHSFLPRSDDGRWKWVRTLQWNKQKINFLKEFEGSALDQPSLFEVLMQPESSEEFFAVLGDPIHHSRTPIEQLPFWKKRNRYSFAIQISKIDFKEDIKILSRLGLSAAAVTSPLKEEAFQFATLKTKDSDELKAINTLIFDKSQKLWIGHNTDFEGLLSVWNTIKNDSAENIKVAVWGGGGTLSIIQKVFPDADFYSSSSGKIRDEKTSLYNSYNIVVWAAPRMNQNLWPDQILNLDQNVSVIDLNYSDNSLGLEWAQKMNYSYISGLKMFLKQAEKQREFWSQYDFCK